MMSRMLKQSASLSYSFGLFGLLVEREKPDEQNEPDQPVPPVLFSYPGGVIFRCVTVRRPQAAACGSYLQSITMARVHRAEIQLSEGSRRMTPATLIEQELVAAQSAQQDASLPLPIRQAA